VITLTGGTISGGVSVTEAEQLLPGHGCSQRVRLVLTFTETVIVPCEAPVVSSMTSDPLVDERVPPVVDHVKLGLSAPVAVALNVTRLPMTTDEDEARTSQLTAGHGGSVTSKLAVQVV
jgi:hypothetical protein